MRVALAFVAASVQALAVAQQAGEHEPFVPQTRAGLLAAIGT